MLSSELNFKSLVGHGKKIFFYRNIVTLHTDLRSQNSGKFLNHRHQLNVHMFILLRHFEQYIASECVTKSDFQSEMIIFESLLTTFEECSIFETAGVVAKIGHTTITKLNQVMLFQICDTHCA